MATALSRRSFLKGAALAGGALTIGFTIDRPRAAMMGGPAKFNAFLRIDDDGSVVFVSPFCEMGQGIHTAQAQMLAEELEYPIAGIKIEEAPSDPAYAMTRFTFPGSDGEWINLDLQLTGGSRSTSRAFDKIRMTGATAREMLREAAAKHWGVPLSECRARDGAIHHGGKRLSYAELAGEAATLEPPEVALKQPHEWTVIGRSVPRIDLPDKVQGKARFGIDTKPEGALVATVVHAPMIGGTLRSVDDAPALAVRGVRDVVPITMGIAVVADTYWQALTGARALDPIWDHGPRPSLSIDEIRDDLHASLDEPGSVVIDEGDTLGGLEKAAERHEAVYEVPFVPHMTMEPMNAAARVDPDGVEIWMPTQSPTNIQMALSWAWDIPQESIRVHTTLLGGGFGRRGEADVAIEAAEIARAVGHPVQVIWPRDQDIGCHCSMPGPMAMARMRGGLDESGRLRCLDAEIASPSIMTRFLPQAVSNGVDFTTIQGMGDQPYAIPDRRVATRLYDPGLPVSFWRSVSHRPNAFFIESFLNEIAHKTGTDPFELRARMIPEELPAARNLLRVLRDASGWDLPPLPGRARGVALHRCMGTLVGQVAEVSVDFEDVRVHRMTCVIDCGPTVNPDIVRAQMEGSIVDGLNTAFNGGITIKDGRIEQSEFYDFDWIRIGQVPEIEVRLAPGQEHLGGSGEPGLPPVAPAVADAIFRASGTRVRTLPFAAAGFRLV